MATFTQSTTAHFLESDYPIDDAFSDLIIILRPSVSDVVLAKQRKLMDSWTRRAALRLALVQPHPHRFALQILNARLSLGTSREMSAELQNLVQRHTLAP